ncbi:apotyrosinase chaperone MelC1 [Streptomyces sp. NBC_00503]|uniref:apotyrosinase chaperone MelC1 n=1 Tax=Streptomyces sp. NBC_00503 TaxID=2903659 RepID=UPI002E804139|nr:tyrosinase family oxidase copper chaperone [Streptomyces sp. NBC_00503]WUD83204.1 tyrosinase cofactor [Streptomyces sp. NBC_00503]
MKKITRRHALGIAAGATTALGLTACTSKSAGSPAAGASGSPASGSPASIPAGGIDEVFEGRRIQIALGAGGHHGVGVPTVKIDGNELHIMPNADGTWVSVVNHYQTYPNPVEAARAAIRDLQGAALVPFAPKGGVAV